MVKVRKNFLTLFLLSIILLISFFIRTYKLDSIPNGFHIDEAIIADNANFILHTGYDTDNHFMPLQTEVFGDYNPMGYAYLAIPAIKIFGFTIFALRSIGGFLSIISILGTFFLVYSIFEEKTLSLLTSLFVALSPWEIVLSRSTEETVSSLPFIILGFALLIWSIKKEKITYLLLATSLLFISYFMYFTPRFFVPLLFLAFFVSFRYWYIKRKTLFTKVFIGCFIFVGFTAVLLTLGFSGGTNRFSQVSIFGFPETKLIMEEQIREDGVMNSSVLETRIFHNKIINYFLTYSENYLEYFSGDFLFIKGGLPAWLSVPSMGVMYLVELPFILYGLFQFFRNKRRWGFILIAWVLLAPAAASLTVDDIPNVRRALVMVPVLELLAAYGVINIIRNTPNNLRLALGGVITVFFVMNVFYFFHQYFVHYPIHKNWYRYEGFDKAMAIVNKDYSKSDLIVISKSFGGIYPLVLFYSNFNPSSYLKAGSPKDETDTGFGKFFFVRSACPSIDSDPKVPKVNRIIFIDNGVCPYYSALKHLKHTDIYRKDGTKAFRLVYE